MAVPKVNDVTLLLDAIPHKNDPWEYTAALFDSLPEEGESLARQKLEPSLDAMCLQALQQPTAAGWGETIFDWVFPRQSQIRTALLHRCEDATRSDTALRLWICIGPALERYDYFQRFERLARVSWEGFWVREWREGAARPARIESPFLALNPGFYIVRCPPRVERTNRRFTIAGKLNVLIVVSNPPPGSSEWPHIDYLERADGTGMFLRVYRAFHSHQGVGWVHRLRNPTIVGIARCIRDYKPHVVIYLGHGYARPDGAGLVLAVAETGNEFAKVSGLRKFSDVDSELEKMLAGKVEALTNPEAHDAGLPEEERPRLFIAIACEVAAAAPVLLQCGIPAVLAMRREIPDSESTEAMVQHCAAVLTDESLSVEEAIADLRRFLQANESLLAEERLHFSVPVLHLGKPG